MNLPVILSLALALAMDAFAVSIATGFAIKNMRIKHALAMATWFGLFQAIMPVLGWLTGFVAHDWVAAIDHWVVFGLLSFIGVKMIYEAFKIKEVEQKTDHLTILTLFGLALATSIDAFGAGVSFAMLNVAIITPAVLIGLVTFVTSFAGAYIGDKGGHFFESKIEVIGGIILILIGMKVLLEHLLT